MYVTRYLYYSMDPGIPPSCVSVYLWESVSRIPPIKEIPDWAFEFTAVQSILFHTYVALIQTVYRALLTSAVSGIGHRIHTPKKMCRLMACSDQSALLCSTMPSSDGQTVI